MKNTLAIVVCLAILSPLSLSAQSWGYNNHRFAVSADGNNQPDKKHKWTRADPDDWGGTPAALAMIAKLGLHDKLVHYSYNNFIDAPPHTTETNHMKIGADGAIERWNFDKDKFFDVSENHSIPINHLAAEIAKSSSLDPLYFIHMGPAEFFYRAVKKVIDDGKINSLSHVYVVSHSGYNDDHLRRGDPKFDITPVPDSEKHHTMSETIAASGDRINYKKIKDQNGGHDPNILWKSDKDWTVWHWMRDHKDPNIQWIFDRMLVNAKSSADISDAGMIFYLLHGDIDGSPSKFKAFIGDGISNEKIVSATGIEVPIGEKVLMFKHQLLAVHASVLPLEATNQKINYTSSSPEIVKIKDGQLFAQAIGTTKVTASTADGSFSKTFDVVIEELPSCDDYNATLNALEDFNDLNIDGFVPAYKDEGRKALAVNAGTYKEMFAAATTIFSGNKGIYDITITTVKEEDGESTYRLRISGQLIGEFQNPETEIDMEATTHTFDNVVLKEGDVIQVEFNSTSNGKIPEGDAFAFARGRWRQLHITCGSIECPEDENCIDDEEGEATSINHHSKLGIKVYPNPSDGVLSISEVTNDSQIKIYSTSGKIVFTEMISSSKTDLDIRALQEGLYLIEINNGKDIQLTRLIKQ
ncbi:T9SS type A sorting domain-containing protein [Reichenbachiella versicolor]|uniref:T9SS type A sorting domain-containing protein n=1 Tax=Reichenbachiella versicolor TaxID=1821036 RepID=UPI0013A58A5F|nr:T9SS type A sorting domain-containing protein [Reichenbachiella versicolor]